MYRPFWDLHSTTQPLKSRTGVKEENGFRYSAEFSETSASWSSFSVALVDGLGPTFRVSLFVHDMIFGSPPYMVYLLHIIDVLIFSVRFSVVGGKIQFQFCAHVSGTPTNSYSTWIWHEYRPVSDWTDLHLGQSSLAKSEACELFARSCHPQNSTNAVLQLIVQKFGEVWFKVWWFKVLTHYLHLSTLFYGGLWFLCIQGGDIFGFLFTINRINRIQR